MALGEELKEIFQQQFATWVRIESRCRSNDLSQGIQAKIADPLWLLARQWQFGEFQGEDAGSPIKLEYSYATQSVDTCAITGHIHDYDPSAIPLETLVEQEKPEFDRRSRVRIGQEWERSIRAALPDAASGIIDLFRTVYPVTLPENDEWDKLDYATRQFLTFMQGRVVDGKKLLQAALDTAQFLPVFNDENDPANSTIKDIAKELAGRYQDYHRETDTRTPSAWRSQTLDYYFKLNQPKPPDPDTVPAEPKTRLIAPNYRNGDLDWHTFAIDGEVLDNWTPLKEPIIKTPTRLSIGGTSVRWWAFEDATIDFGDLDVAKPDLAKLALMEFALIYGDDWFSVPVTVNMSNLIKITALTAYNVFGESMSIGSARKIDDMQDKCWDLYSLRCYHNPDDDVPKEPILFIPPVAGFREESKPLEEVHLLRDEGANMVWAIERTILNQIGEPIDGFDAQRERIERRDAAEIRGLRSDIDTIRVQLATETLSDEQRSELEEQISVKLARIEQLERGPYAKEKPKSNAQLRYRLATKVPENWFPFIHVHVPRDFRQQPLISDESIAPQFPMVVRLQRAQMLRNTDDELPTSIPALSRLLDDDADPLLWIDEHTIGRDGLRLQLTSQRVRWIKGKTFVWLGRKVLIGKGEGSSGLRFDVISVGGQR